MPWSNKAGYHPVRREFSGTERQRAGIAAYEALIARLRQVDSGVLAVAAELADGTIEMVLAKSDLGGRQKRLRKVVESPRRGGAAAATCATLAQPFSVSGLSVSSSKLWRFGLNPDGSVACG